ADSPGLYQIKINRDKTKEVRLTRGENLVSIPYKVKKPKFWWPNGMGSPDLYHFPIKLVQNKNILSKIKVRHGYKEVSLIQKKDKKGKSFYFEINGKPLYAKGANWIPNDNFLPRITRKDYFKMIKSAKEANFNMLRVWGGGIYEDDAFYDACDENGILV